MPSVYDQHSAVHVSPQLILFKVRQCGADVSLLSIPNSLTEAWHVVKLTSSAEMTYKGFR